MQQRLKPEQLTERLFEIVNNLNPGFDLIGDITEQLALCELNIRAARRSFSDTACSAALLYYRTAASFLEKPGVKEHLWSYPWLDSDRI